MSLYNPILMAARGADESLVDLDIQFDARMVHYENLTDRTWIAGGDTDRHYLSLYGSNRLFRTLAIESNNFPEFKCVTFGNIKRVRFNVTEMTFNKNLEVQLLEDGVPKSNVIFTLSIGLVTQYIFPPSGSTSIPLLFGKKYCWRFKSTDGGAVTSGIISGSFATEIFWGDGIT